MKKRILALLMVLALCVGLAPAVWADGEPIIDLFMDTNQMPRNNGVITASCGNDGSLRGLHLWAGNDWSFTQPAAPMSNGRVTVSAHNDADKLSVYCIEGDTVSTTLYFTYDASDPAAKSITFVGFSQPNQAGYISQVIQFVKPGGSQPSAGLYDSYDPQTGALGSRLGGLQQMTLNGAEVNGLLVQYTAGTARSVYYFDPNADFGTAPPTVNSNYAFVSVQPIGSRVLCITLSDAAAGYGIISVEYTNGGFPVRFDDASGNPAQTSGGGNQGGNQPSAGLYDSYNPQTGALGSSLGGFQKLTMPNGDEVNGLLVQYTAGTARSVYYFDPNADFGTAPPTVNSNYAFVSVQPIGSRVLCITLSDAAAGYGIIFVEYTNGGFPVRFDDGSDTPAQTSGGGNGNQNPLEGLTQAQESLDASLIDPAPDKFFTGAYSRADISPVPFTYNGQTYYTGVAWYGDHGGNPVDGGSEGYLPGEQDFWHFKVGFWTGRQATAQAIDYTPVSEALYAELYAQFDNLSIGLLRSRECTDRSPAVYRGANSRMTLATNITTVGYWVLKLTGTAKSTVTLAAGGSNLVAYGMSYAHAMAVSNEIAPVSITGLNEVSEFFQTAVNNSAAQIVNGDSLVFKFTIPYKAGGYDGVIVIPEAPAGAAEGGFKCWYDVIGAEGPNGEKLTIRGKIIANSGRTRLWNINFVGTGNLNDPSNVCGTGRGEIRGDRCIFSKYSRAMECTAGTCLKWGFDRCVFQDNGTAIYLAESRGSGGGDCEMYDNTFHRNRIALELAAFSPTNGINVYLIERCKFIDNTCDVKNTSGRAFFMPKNFFVYRDEGGAYYVGEGNVCPNSTSPAFFYPVALQTCTANGIPGTAFTDVIPDTDFTRFDYYTDPAPTVSMGRLYAIPIDALNKTFNVLAEKVGETVILEITYFWFFLRTNP